MKNRKHCKYPVQSRVRHQGSLAIFIAAALCTVPSMNASAAELHFTQKPIEGQYIVVLKESTARLPGEASSMPDVANVAREIGVAYDVKLDRVYSHALRGFSVRASDKQLARLLQDSRIDYIEEDGIISTTATQHNPPWGLDRIDQRNRPLNQRYGYGQTAPNVHVYVVDTGIRAGHPGFGNRVRRGYTAIRDGRGTNDCNGHGTHVAGTVGSVGWGVAKGVKLHPVRVLGCDGSGTWSGFIAGIDWIKANRVRPAVVNMSLSGGAHNAADDAVRGLFGVGIIAVAAAGNNNDNACNYSPARMGRVITVGATTRGDSRSIHSTWASNKGRCVNIFAPGSGIRSTWPGGGTAVLSGTSMAAPHVAGVAARYLARFPGHYAKRVKSELIQLSSKGKLTRIGQNSPNRLLFSNVGQVDPNAVSGEEPGEL